MLYINTKYIIYSTPPLLTSRVALAFDGYGQLDAVVRWWSKTKGSLVRASSGPVNFGSDVCLICVPAPSRIRMPIDSNQKLLVPTPWGGVKTCLRLPIKYRGSW